jgi:endonuclease III
MARKQTVEGLLAEHGTTFCEELGIRIADGTPSALFRWLVACLLFSAPIGHEQAMRAARALSKAGYRTSRKMAEATWEERVKVLNSHGYARYDERTSRMLQDAADLIEDEYKGDLRRLREAAGHDPAEERRRLKAVKGVGDVGVDIFFREVQETWDELYPFADKLALKAAARQGLGEDAATLARTVPREDFPRLVAALVREELAR